MLLSLERHGDFIPSKDTARGSYSLVPVGKTAAKFSSVQGDGSASSNLLHHHHLYGILADLRVPCL